MGNPAEGISPETPETIGDTASPEEVETWCRKSLLYWARESARNKKWKDLPNSILERTMPVASFLMSFSISRQEQTAADMRDSIKRQENAMERQERLSVDLLWYTKGLWATTIVLLIAAVLTLAAAIIPLLH